jgi:hypothetical protein
MATMQQTADQVLACILRQLVQYKALPRELDEAYDKWIRQGQRNRPDGQFFAGLVTQCSKEFKACFVVLDAFDECGEEERDTLVIYLQQFLVSGVRVYVTTRPHLRDPLVEFFGRSSLLEITADAADIEVFVKESLKGKRVSDSVLKEDILNVIRQADAKEYALSSSI